MAYEVCNYIEDASLERDTLFASAKLERTIVEGKSGKEVDHRYRIPHYCVVAQIAATEFCARSGSLSATNCLLAPT
jgi:hypothetical protein